MADQTPQAESLRMNCFFCSTPLIDPQCNGILECPTCVHATRYICSGSMPNPDVWYVHLRIDPYLVEWDLEVPITRIYSGPMYQERNFIMALEQTLPYSLQDVIQFVDRIHNLKVFL